MCSQWEFQRTPFHICDKWIDIAYHLKHSFLPLLGGAKQWLGGGGKVRVSPESSVGRPSNGWRKSSGPTWHHEILYQVGDQMGKCGKCLVNGLIWHSHDKQWRFLLEKPSGTLEDLWKCCIETIGRVYLFEADTAGDGEILQWPHPRRGIISKKHETMYVSFLFAATSIFNVTYISGWFTTSRSIF